VFLDDTASGDLGQLLAPRRSIPAAFLPIWLGNLAEEFTVARKELGEVRDLERCTVLIDDWFPAGRADPATRYDPVGLAVIAFNLDEERARGAVLEHTPAEADSLVAQGRS